MQSLWLKLARQSPDLSALSLSWCIGCLRRKNIWKLFRVGSFGQSVFNRRSSLAFDWKIWHRRQIYVLQINRKFHRVSVGWLRQTARCSLHQTKRGRLAATWIQRFRRQNLFIFDGLWNIGGGNLSRHRISRNYSSAFPVWPSWFPLVCAVLINQVYKSKKIRDDYIADNGEKTWYLQKKRSKRADKKTFALQSCIADCNCGRLSNSKNRTGTAPFTRSFSLLISYHLSHIEQW